MEYDVNNQSGADVQMGTRVLLDTMVGNNDGPEFQNGTASENVQTTERTFVRGLKVGETVDGVKITDENLHYYDMDTYWVMKDVLDPANPLATNVYAYGFNNFSNTTNVVDRIVVGHWNHLANSKFDVDVDPNLDFTTDTNDYGTADSAVAFYWNNQTIAAKGSQTYQVIYGLGEIVNSSSVFSIQFLGQANQLQTDDAQAEYQNEGVFKITVEAENLESYNLYHTSATCTLTLESGLDFVETKNGEVVRTEDQKPKLADCGRTQKKTYTKSRTADDNKKRDAEIEQTGSSNIGKIAPGEKVTFTFTVLATGKAWPTTRQYMAEVTSPELEKKYSEAANEDVKALYQCSKSDLVFLPAIGIAQQTYSYAMTPGEAYYSDEKIINVNLSNIEAYNVGAKDQKGNYVPGSNNFDVYLADVITGARYKVDVQDSVLLIGSGDGSTGDMRISYRGGTKVDSAGNLLDDSMADDPTLPLGQYAVQVDYHGDAKNAQLYDFTTTQTFSVTSNTETRIRTAGYLVIAKRWLKMSDADYGVYCGIIEALNKTAESLDPTYEAYTPKENVPEYVGDKLQNTYVPQYEYQLFDTKAEIDQYRDEINETNKNSANPAGEILVTIEGMVKEQDGNIYVDTDTEPAIINGCVAYSGKDLAITTLTGLTDAIGSTSTFSGALASALSKSNLSLETGFGFGGVSASGDGTLSIASSGFVFHSGKWSLDFYNGFEKSLQNDDSDEKEDDNGMIDWAAGSLSDALNPLKTITLPEVYFNRKSLFSTPSFSVAGFGLSFSEFILSQSDGDNMISFGGDINLMIIDADVKNVFFDQKGFYGIESQLGFSLDGSVGLLKGEDDDGTGGTITINHYRPGVDAKSKYGVNFQAELREGLGVSCELSFKQVDDGRILPDVILFDAALDPGIMIYADTYINDIHGGLRELADTIAGGNSQIPLTILAGVGLTFGEEPAEFEGNVDLTLKMSGFKLEGDLQFDGQKMLTYALIQAQWGDPWFIQAKADVDVFGWNIIVGEARIFVGKNTKKNRTDFEGYLSARLQIPENIPIVSGKSLGGVCMGIDNDKIYGSKSIGIGAIAVNVTVTYYWSGGLKISTDSRPDDDALAYLLVTDEKTGDQRLIGIGSGIKTIARSKTAEADPQQTIVYHDLQDGVQLLQYTSNSADLSTIQVSDFGKTHSIPVNEVYSADKPADAMIQVEYFGDHAPELALTDGEDHMTGNGRVAVRGGTVTGQAVGIAASAGSVSVTGISGNPATITGQVLRAVDIGEGCSAVTLSYAELTGGSEGIACGSACTLNVSNCAVSGADDAIRISGASNLRLSNTSAESTSGGNGVTLSGAGASLALSAGASVTGSKDGIQITQPSTVTISGGLVKGKAGDGVNIDADSTVHISGGSVTGSEDGVSIGGTSTVSVFGTTTQITGDQNAMSQNAAGSKVTVTGKPIFTGGSNGFYKANVTAQTSLQGGLYNSIVTSAAGEKLSNIIAVSAVRESALTSTRAAQEGSLTVTNYVLSNNSELKAAEYDDDGDDATAKVQYKEFFILGSSAPESSGGSSGGGDAPAASGAEVIAGGKTQAAGTIETFNDTNGQSVSAVTLDTDKLQSILSGLDKDATITVPVTGSSDVAEGILTGQMIQNMGKQSAILEIRTDSASYTIPAAKIDIDAVSEELGADVDPADLTITIQIAQSTDSERNLVESAAKKNQFTVLASPVRFTINCAYNGMKVEVSDFNAYVKRMIKLPNGVDPGQVTTGVSVKPDGTVRHIPTCLTEIDGSHYVVMNSLTNSTYAVVRHQVKFSDVEGHWAQSAINDMGSRMIVSGVSKTNFEPDRSITRSEFAAIMVRALGLAPGSGITRFSDVPSSKWYAGYVDTAFAYGIINGYDENTFGPEDRITREQAMTMIARAMKLTGLSVETSEQTLNQFADASGISTYAADGVAACISAGLVNGRDGTVIAPRQNITRAEIAVMIQRLLQKSKLI